MEIALETDMKGYELMRSMGKITWSGYKNEWLKTIWENTENGIGLFGNQWINEDCHASA